jgi:hypothetical protein
MQCKNGHLKWNNKKYIKMNEAKKKTNKFFYCFKQYYNFQTGILKRGNSCDERKK